MNIRSAAVVVAVLAVAGLVGVGGYALAQSGDGPPWREGPPWHAGWGGDHRGRWAPDPERVAEVRAELAADLAAELDTTAAAVEAAFRDVVAQRLQEAVDAGRIDQDRADEALAAYDDGELRVLFRVLKRQGAETEPS